MITRTMVLKLAAAVLTLAFAGCSTMGQMTGNMKRVAAQDKRTAASVEGAAARGGNYAHVMPPSELPAAER